MVEYYNDIGKITIVLDADDYNISSVEIGGVIYDTDRDVSFTVQNILYDTGTNRITVYGYTCNWLLDNRVLAKKKYFSNVEQGVYEAIEYNLRGLYAVEVAQAQGFPERSDSVLYGGQLLSKLIPVMQTAGIGQRMAWDPDRRVHIFTQYKGQDLTNGIHAVTFCEEHGTAPDLYVSVDSSPLKNYVYVQGTLLDDTEIIEEVGAQESAETREYWLRNTYSQDRDETVDALRQRMRAAGLDEIAARISRSTFSVSVRPDEYGVAYRLGDIVAASSVRFGIALTARITGVQYTSENGSEKIELIMGEPRLTALGEMKMNYG